MRLRSYDASYTEFSRLVEKAGASYEIPNMPRWVGIKVVWPFGGAAARVLFFDRETPENSVSTYLDVNDELGCMDLKPYFEIYPDADGDTTRFWQTSQAEMYPAIVRALAKRRRQIRRETARGAS